MLPSSSYGTRSLHVQAMNRILVFSPGSAQDQLLLFPSLAALPSQVDVVAPPETQEVYNLCPHVNRVIPFDLLTSKGLADWSNLYGVAREREYEAALTVSNLLSIRMMLWLLGIPVRVGVTGGTGEFLLTHAVPTLDHLPRVLAYRDLLQVVNASPAQEIALSIPSSSQKWANQQLGDESRSETVLLYDETSNRAQSSYGPNAWVSVIQGLRDRRPGISPVLLESRHNQAWIAQVRDHLANVPVIRAESFSQAAAVINKARILVTSDNPALYAGLGTSCAVVGLFGRRKPELYLPQGDRAIGLSSNTGTLADIAPIQVIESIEKVIESTKEVVQSSVLKKAQP
ncbi:MAG: glycosyltransferase family 9 protein [Cyanobacteria bacterium P01_F01_bin.42]